MTKHLRIFMLTLLTIVCALEGYAQETATLTFKEACNGKGTDDQKGEWVITSDSKESQFDSSRGIHYGTSKATVSYLKATSSSYSDKKITKIVVNSSAANSGSPKINCTVGGKAFGETYNLTATNAAYSFNGEATGEIVVNISKTESTKALYLLSVAVTFEDTATPQPPLPPLVPTQARHSHSPMASLMVLPRLQLPLQRATTTPTCLTLLNIQALTQTS